MKGLVTVFGGSGFVGRQVVRALARDGARIRVAVRNPGRGYRLRMLGDVGQIELAQANVRDQASVERALDGAEACVDAVGVLYASGRQTFEALHVEAARRLARAARASGAASFVHLSALGADPASPSLYARTKALGEAEAREAFPDAVILRPSVVFGAEDAFFNRFARLATFSPALPLIGGGETRFQPAHVADVAEAAARAVTFAAARGRTFELGGPGVYSFRQLMEIMLRTIERPRLLVPVPFPLAMGLGALGDLAAMASLTPPLTRDQVTLLKSDNTVSPGAPGFADLGIAPAPLEAILPGYLYVYRPGGQYAAPPP